jgi:hypothetical protein
MAIELKLEKTIAHSMGKAIASSDGDRIEAEESDSLRQPNFLLAANFLYNQLGMKRRSKEPGI